MQHATQLVILATEVAKKLGDISADYKTRFATGKNQPTHIRLLLCYSQCLVEFCERQAIEHIERVYLAVEHQIQHLRITRQGKRLT